MREIEFRVWLKNEKKMVEVEEINFEHSFIQYKKYEDDEIGYDDKYIDFEDVELMEYTGKNDKHNNKIFEHYLIMFDGMKYIYEVVWDDESSSYKLQNRTIGFEWDYLELRTFKTKAIEVIGNIYENPELLGCLD